MKELLSFDSMTTPKIINIVYWLMLFVMVIGGVTNMFTLGGVMGFLLGILMIVVGSLLVRIYCELMIVLFKMNEALQEIKNK